MLQLHYLQQSNPGSWLQMRNILPVLLQILIILLAGIGSVLGFKLAQKNKVIDVEQVLKRKLDRIHVEFKDKNRNPKAVLKYIRIHRALNIALLLFYNFLLFSLSLKALLSDSEYMLAFFSVNALILLFNGFMAAKTKLQLLGKIIGTNVLLNLLLAGIFFLIIQYDPRMQNLLAALSIFERVTTMLFFTLFMGLVLTLLLLPVSYLKSRCFYPLQRKKSG